MFVCTQNAPIQKLNTRTLDYPFYATWTTDLFRLSRNFVPKKCQ